MRTDKNTDNMRDMSHQAFAEFGSSNLVYIKAVIARDVMDDLSDEEDQQITAQITDETVLYALHAADGVRLALAGDRDLAFAAARQNEMTPVSVH